MPTVDDLEPLRAKNNKKMTERSSENTTSPRGCATTCEKGYTMDEFLKSRFKSDLTFIQNAGNYYAQFKYVLDKCATAELENILLFDMGYFSDAEFRNNVSIIHTAKEKAIKTHGEWVIKMFEQSTTRHTPRTFVSSVYSDIFGIVLTP